MTVAAHEPLSQPPPDDRVWRFLDRAIARLAKRAVVASKGRKQAVAVERSHALRIERVRRAAHAVCSFELASPDGSRLPEWQPGHHLDVTLPSGKQRQYSLCGDPSDRERYRIAVRLIPNGQGSAELHGLAEGSALRVSSPRNAFPFVIAPRYFFIAAGIGITPILPMAAAAAARGADWTLIYTGRSRASMPFLDELAALSSASAGRLVVLADDESGVPSAQGLLELAPEAAPLYCCGPTGLIEALRARMPNPRVTSLHYERFTPAPVVASSPFELVLRRSGKRVMVAADETALHAIQRVLPHAAYSCQQGFCGTCKVRVLDGEVEHRDCVLTPEQRREAMTPCVSRGVGRVVIDM